MSSTAPTPAPKTQARSSPTPSKTSTSGRSSPAKRRPNPGNRKKEVVKTKVAHYGEWAAMGVAVPTAAATIATPYLPDSLATVTYAAAWLGVAGGLGALTISALWHRGLCEACIAAVPLNAPQLGARYKRQFAVIHALTGTRTRFTVGALVTAMVM